MIKTRTGISLISLFLCLVLCLSLFSCGAKSTTDQLNDFIAGAKDELETMKASFDETLDIRLEARDKSLVYVFQYKEDTGIDNEILKESLDSAMDSMSATFASILSALKKEVADADSIIVEYQDKDGTVITSRDFK